MSQADEFEDVDSCYTKVNLKTIRFKWTISNYDFVATSMKMIRSPDFPFDENEKQKWYIEFKPFVIKKDSNETVEFCFKRKFSSEIRTSIILYLKTSSGKEYKTSTSILVLNKLQYMVKYIPVSAMAESIFWDESSYKDLTLLCEIQTVDSAEDICRQPSNDTVEFDSLLNDISTFIDDQSFKDFTFFVHGEKFEVHKNILAARSPVFAAMFSHEMSENINSTAEVTDIKPEIFKKMLHFIYTDNVDHLQESVSELFIVAEKYNLKKLKQMCIVFMYRNLSLENILETLELADTYSIPKLKREALRFLISDFKKLKEVEEFERLIKSRPHLAIELVKLQEETDSNCEKGQEKIIKASFEFNLNN